MAAPSPGAQTPVASQNCWLFRTRRSITLLFIIRDGIRLLTTNRRPSRRGRALPNLCGLSLTHKIASELSIRQRRCRNHNCQSYEQQFHFNLHFSNATQPHGNTLNFDRG